MQMRVASQPQLLSAEELVLVDLLASENPADLRVAGKMLPRVFSAPRKVVDYAIYVAYVRKQEKDSLMQDAIAWLIKSTAQTKSKRYAPVFGLIQEESKLKKNTKVCQKNGQVTD